MELQRKAKKHLVLVTSSFPCGKGEPYLNHEFPFLLKNFEKILIISHHQHSSNSHVPPEINLNLVRYEPYNKIPALLFIFNSLFWKELAAIIARLNKKISVGILKTMLVSSFNAKRLASVYYDILQKNKIAKDALIYSYWCNDSALALVFLKKNNPEYKIITRVHGWDIYFEPSRYGYLPYRNYIAENMDSIYTISTSGMIYCYQKWKIKNQLKIKLARLGVKPQKILYPSKGSALLVSCSNMISLKRLDLIVDALSLIKIPGLHWVHIGDGEEHEAILNKARKLLTGKVSFHFMGRLDNNAVLEWYSERRPHLFVNLSSTEGIPVSIMEAFSFGIPAIATAVGGTPEIVNNENGILLPANPTADEVADAITAFFMLLPEQQEKKRKAAWECCFRNFNANKNYAEFVKEIISL